MRQVSLGEETTWGTSVAVTRALEVISWNVKPNHFFKDIKTIRSKSALGTVYGGYVGEGPCQLAASYQGQGFLFKHLIGSVTTTGAADPRTHRFPATTGIGTADRFGMGLTAEEVLEENLVWRWSGGKIESLKLSIPLDDVATYDLGLVFKSFVNDATETTLTPATFSPLIPNQCFITWAGGAEMPAQSLEVEIKNPVSRTRTMRAAGLAREPRRSDVIEVQFTAHVLFEAFADWYSSFNGTTTGQIVMKAVKTAVTEELRFTAPVAVIQGDTPVLQGYDLATVPFVAKAYFSSDADESCRIEMFNNDDTP